MPKPGNILRAYPVGTSAKTGTGTQLTLVQAAAPDLDESAERKTVKPLTAAAVARYQPTAKRREVPDGGSQGLRLVIQPSGAKSWAMRFRRPNGKTAKITLGPVDLSGTETPAEPILGAPLTLAAARRLAAELQRQRAIGRDVASDCITLKRQRRTAAQVRSESTFPRAAQQFIVEHASAKTRRWKETARLLGLSPLDFKVISGGLADRWHDKPITEISTDDVYALVDEARRQGIPGIGRRNTGLSEARARAVFSCLSKMFAWLVAHRRTKINPCIGIPRPAAPPARERVLSDSEIRWFWTACDALGSPFGPLLKILLVTGARLNEVARMTCHELSEDGSTWVLSGARTKNRRSHVLVLPPLAQEILAEVKIISGEAAFVFSTTGHTPVSGFSKMKARLDREMRALAGKDVPPWRLHDLRRTAATGMARAGADLHVIERALNHVSGSFGGIVAVYQRHKFEAEIKRALEAWTDLLRKTIRQ